MMTRWFNSLPYVSPIVNEFIITVKTDNAGVSASNQILLPIQGTNMVIDWGDGSVSTHTQTLAPNNTIGGNNVTHTYASAGVYQIKISPSITSIFFNNGGDRLKLLNINNFGKSAFTNIDFGFFGCINMVIDATDEMDLSLHTQFFRSVFQNCSSVTKINTENWDLSNLVFFNQLFSGCTSLQNINTSNWNLQNCQNLFATFASCSNLQTIQCENWNLSSVTTMTQTFFNCVNLTELNTSNWNISNNQSFSGTFQACNSLNQTFGNFVLNTNVNLANMLHLSNATIGTNFQEAYSRTLIGWANNIFSRGGVVTGRSLGANNRRYNNINYVSGQQFNNAVDARNYLVNTLGWTITGDAQV